MLKELQQIADSADPIKRARGRRGLEMLNRIQRNTNMEVRIHDGDFPEGKRSGRQAGPPCAQSQRPPVHQRLQPHQGRRVAKGQLHQSS
ncbi:MAG: hypothetical protein WDM76_06040 [Limisphaerales bacterium]